MFCNSEYFYTAMIHQIDQNSKGIYNGKKDFYYK